MSSTHAVLFIFMFPILCPIPDVSSRFKCWLMYSLYRSVLSIPHWRSSWWTFEWFWYSTDWTFSFNMQFFNQGVLSWTFHKNKTTGRTAQHSQWVHKKCQQSKVPHI
jgi:hypothetical protein